MQSRRHVMVAVVVVSIQLVSLAAATDILGADISDYAAQSESIEATGTEADSDDSRADDEASDLSLGDEWSAFDFSELVLDEVVPGVDEAPDQLLVVDELDQPVVDKPDQTLVEAEPVIDEPGADVEAATVDPSTTTTAAPASASSTSVSPAAGISSTTAIADDDPTSGAVTSTTTSGAVTSTTTAGRRSTTTLTSPLAEATGLPGAAAVVDRTTTTAAPSSTSPATVDPTSAAAPPSGSSPTPTGSTTVPETTSPAPVTQPTDPTTTWLPVTTDTPITTWVTTIPASTAAPATTTTTSTTTLIPVAPTSGTVAPTSPSTTQPSTTTAAPTTVPSTTAAPTTSPPTTAAPSGGSANDGLSAISNTDPRFSRYASVRSDNLSLADLTEPAPVKDNGTVGDGQFRAACQYSHFAYDDPIVYPGQPGRSHLHMFFGNTETDAFSTTESIVNSGGGSCNGFELNRSAYWTPALLDGKGNAVVPDMIILYYKSKEPGNVQRMPQGLKMLSGNTSAESFAVSDFLYWSCGESGYTYNKSNRIPNCNGDTINATIAFPQCWDGVNMDSADHRSHMALVSPHKACPSSHPVRLPQISILMYFPGQSSTSEWHLSSDRSGGFNTGNGATLHADWWGGWNDETMDLWTNGCMKGARNCSFGQTATNRQLAKLNNFQNYPGQNFLPLP